MKTADGAWEGISIDLWAAVAAKLGVAYELRETDLPGMIDEVVAGKLDLSIAAMTITAARERLVDFSHPFYHTGLGVAVAERPTAGLHAIWKALAGPTFLTIVAIVLGLLFLVGALAWALERKHNPQHFEPDAKRGLFSGFWWAAVTMTTTGYGDKVPATTAGRFLTILWMFAALVLTAAFTAHLAAAMTANFIRGPVSTPSDLARVRVGNVQDAASLAILRDYGARPVAYPDTHSGLLALARGEIDAFVHDETILIWESHSVSDVVITPVRFAPQYYAIVLPEDATMHEAVDRALLSVLASDQWTTIQRRYLGGENWQ